eukprot:GEZU01029419.1.p1 GENE.GEZU01029419.1~~GEZU01029419.1.p1  ORF type:complete len:169 (+),score=6.94 GEZU01029419.1:24-509(+)
MKIVLLVALILALVGLSYASISCSSPRSDLDFCKGIIGYRVYAGANVAGSDKNAHDTYNEFVQSCSPSPNDECKAAARAYYCTFYLRKCEGDIAAYKPCENMCQNVIDRCSAFKTNVTSIASGCYTRNTDCSSDAHHVLTATTMPLVLASIASALFMIASL